MSKNCLDSLCSGAAFPVIADEAVDSLNRKKLIVAAMTDSTCLHFPALDAILEGFDVHGVIDASVAALVGHLALYSFLNSYLLAVSPRTSREIRLYLVRDFLTLRLPFVIHSLTFLTMTWERASISSDRTSSIPRLMIPSLVATMYTSGLVPVASILFFMQHSSHPSTTTRFSSSRSSSSSGRFRAVSWRCRVISIGCR